MEQINTCMLISHDGESIRARPMHARPRESERAVYFLTSATGGKDEEIREDEHVCLTFAEPNDGKYLTVQGNARVLNDRELIRALWNTAAQAWWEGPDDPSVRVIEVTPDSAEYWDRPHGLVHRTQFAIAAASALPAQMGDQAKVDLH
jgi:general stress protein 26